MWILPQAGAIMTMRGCHYGLLPDGTSDRFGVPAPGRSFFCLCEGRRNCDYIISTQGAQGRRHACRGVPATDNIVRRDKAEVNFLALKNFLKNL